MKSDRERFLLSIAIFSLLVLVIFGTFIFQFLEGWSAVDAFYFTGVTMTTVGYGDMVPRTDMGKIISVIFGFVSIGITLYAINMIARLAFHHHERKK